MTTRTMMAGLSATAFERIVTNSTAASLNSTTRKAAGSVLRLSVETADVRYRSDGTAPTATTGVLLQSDTAYEFYGFNGTSVFQFIDTGSGGVVNVERYQYPGEEGL